MVYMKKNWYDFRVARQFSAAVSAHGRFSARTFQRMDISAHGRFSAAHLTSVTEISLP
jgi:hypothetical protein